MRVLKHHVPVDDQWHPLPLGLADVLHVACQYGPESVQVWAQALDTTRTSSPREFRVFGTGQHVADDRDQRFRYIHWGSVVTAGGSLVWHLFERVAW